MKFHSLNLGKALVMGAFLFSAEAVCAKAKTAEKKSEKSKVKVENHIDLIEKAQALSLQGARLQAVTILTSAIAKETKKPQVVRELTTSLDQVARVFVSEKAQQSYEVGLSLKNTDPNTAQGKLSEAAKIEPENLEIDLASARIFLMQNDCDKALAKMERWKEALPYIEELKLIQAQANLCKGEFKEYLSMKPADTRKSLSWQTLEAEHSYKSGQFSKTLEIAEQLSRSHPTFPESTYWIFKSKLELKQNAENSGQKYLSQCKSISGRAQREYLFEPQLCRRTAEVELALKKMTAGGS